MQLCWRIARNRDVELYRSFVLLYRWFHIHGLQMKVNRRIEVMGLVSNDLNSIHQDMQGYLLLLHL